MEKTEKIYQQKNTEMDIPSIVRALTREWWVILLCGCILAMWAYMAVSVVNTPSYTSSATLVITSNGSNSAVYTDTALEKVAGQYQKVLTSSALSSKIKEEMGWEQMPGTLSASVVTGTNLVLLQGTAQKPGDAYLLVKAALNNYTQVSEYLLSSFSLEEMKSPSIPSTPSNAGSALSWALKALLLGIVASGAVIAVMTILRDDIKNEGQVSALLDIPLFASIYFESKKGRKKGKMSGKTEGILITSPVTSMGYTENLKKLASKVDYRARKNHAKIILVSSVLENEGKSTVAANLALALSEKSRRVLLLDGDLRKPSLYKLFEKELPPEEEIGNFLQERTTASQCLCHDKETGLYYMFGSRSYRNSDLLLASSNMKTILKQAKSVVDYIVIDSAPLSISSDAEILADQADAVLLVVRQCASGAGDINDAADLFRKSKAELWGCVFNAVKTRVLPQKKGGYGYGYGKKYGNYGQKVSPDVQEGGE